MALECRGLSYCDEVLAFRAAALPLPPSPPCRQFGGGLVGWWSTISLSHSHVVGNSASRVRRPAFAPLGLVLRKEWVIVTTG